MAPTTRSRIVNASASASPSPTRKVPHCTKCHQPRAGHPRQGCPNLPVSSPSSSSPDLRTRSSSTATATTARSKKPDSRGLNRALNNLYIQMPSAPCARRPRLSAPARLEEKRELYEDDEDDEQGHDNDSETSVLSTGSRDDVERMLSGSGGASLFSSSNTSKGANNRSSHRRHMPCSMGTPWTSFYESGFVTKAEESTNEPEMVWSQTTEPTQSKSQAGQSVSSSSAKPPTPRNSSGSHRPHQAKPLTRSLSAEGRAEFLLRLSETERPIVLSFPKDEVDDLRKRAMSAKFHTLTVSNFMKTGETWVVFGRDVKAVEGLAETLKGLKGNAALGQMAGAFSVGAATLFAGLAYS